MYIYVEHMHTYVGYTVHVLASTLYMEFKFSPYSIGDGWMHGQKSVRN